MEMKEDDEKELEDKEGGVETSEKRPSSLGQGRKELS